MCKSEFLGCAHLAMKLIETEGLRNVFTRFVGRAVMLIVIADIALRLSVRGSLGVFWVEIAEEDGPALQHGFAVWRQIDGP